MLRKFSAILLVLGWICLSGFDVVEDLDALSASPASVSANVPEEAGFPKRGFLVHRANNMVELAYGTHQVEITLSRFLPDHSFSFASTPVLRLHSLRHVLFRVLLI